MHKWHNVKKVYALGQVAKDFVKFIGNVFSLYVTNGICMLKRVYTLGQRAGV